MTEGAARTLRERIAHRIERWRSHAASRKTEASYANVVGSYCAIQKEAEAAVFLKCAEQIEAELEAERAAVPYAPPVTFTREDLALLSSVLMNRASEKWYQSGELADDKAELVRLADKAEFIRAALTRDPSPPQEGSSVRAYAHRQLAVAMEKEADAPASAAQHEMQAFLALKAWETEHEGPAGGRS